MEKKFQDLLKKTKAHERGETEAAKTFEFNLFSEGNWFLSMNQLDDNLKRAIPDQVIEKNPPENQSNKSDTEKAINDFTLNPNHQLKVLFVGDTYNGEDEDLLQKMIVAMKLNSSEYKRIKLDPDLELILDPEENANQPSETYKNFTKLISSEAPGIVISLGALTTNLLLGKREKMSTIHGKYFKIELNNFQLILMPLFHPDFLLINPNMKRTAWIDLQKVMGTLGKI